MDLLIFGGNNYAVFTNGNMYYETVIAGNKDLNIRIEEYL